jgi:DNA polymerase bacteriophage-type
MLLPTSGAAKMLQPSPQYVNAAATTTHALHRDYETRSRAILKTVGALNYAADPSTEVLCCAYAVDDEPVKLWRPGDPVPVEFVTAAQSQNWIVAAHNDSFETALEKLILTPQYKWPVIPIERHRCTMAMSLACGLPGRLSTVADALELEHRKDAAGERLMHQTTKPRRAHKSENPDSIYWFDDPERLNRLYSYCAQDVEVERELYNRLSPLSQAEQKIWQLSHQINVRGFHIDRTFAEAARKIAEQAAPEIDAVGYRDHRRRRYQHQPSRTTDGMVAGSWLRPAETGSESNRAATRERRR